MIGYQALIAKFHQAYTERWGYIWGKAGVVYTQKDQDYAVRMYNEALAKQNKKGIERWEMTAKYGAKWINRKVADCSGLFAWAYKELGSSIAHGSNSIWSSYTTVKGELKNGKRTDGKPLRPGSAVWRVDGTDYHHIGLYIGDSKVIEAQGTQAGVVISSINRWHAWGELKKIDYDKEEEVTPMDEFKEAVVTADGGVNMRARANTSAARLCVIPQGAKIKAFDMNTGWSKVQYDNKDGYAMTQYISFDTDTIEDNADALKILDNIEKELARLKKMLQA